MQAPAEGPLSDLLFSYLLRNMPQLDWLMQCQQSQQKASNMQLCCEDSKQCLPKAGIMLESMRL